MNELAVLVAVVEAGSLSAAARRLGVSKAAVSDQVRRLETHLGARLLNRTTRRLALTEAGEACVRHAGRMVEAAEAAARDAVRFQEEPQGQLRVAAPTTFAPMHIVPALPAFRARHPRLTVELDLAAALVDIVKERYDVAIRVGPLADSGLTAKRLATHRIIVCASPDYLRRRGVPLGGGDVAAHDTLEFSPLGGRGHWRLRDPAGKPMRLPIQPVLVTDSGEALLAAAIEGLGLAYMPNWMVAPALRAGELVQVLPGWGSPPSAVYAVFPGGGIAAKVRLFVDHIAEHLANADWRS